MADKTNEVEENTEIEVMYLGERFEGGEMNMVFCPLQDGEPQLPLTSYVLFQIRETEIESVCGLGSFNCRYN